MGATRQHGTGVLPHRTVSGEVILGSARSIERGADRGTGTTTGRSGMLRTMAVALGVLAVVAAIVTAIAVAANPASVAAAGAPQPTRTGLAPTGGSSSPTTTPSPQSHTVRPYPDPAGDAGGIAAARARVTEFAAALNDLDMDKANSLLCRALAGQYDESSLEGIEPGSLGVGGVSVQGTTGTAILTYQPTGGGDQGRAIFGLTVENQQWMLCTPS